VDPARPSYERVAWCYEPIASLYSGGAIAAAKASQIAALRSGDRVIYVGVGCGEDAVLAARAGAKVTGLDVSRRMLARTHARLQRMGVEAELRCESLFDHSPRAAYDSVCANFVLNLFPEALMRTALATLVGWLRPGGRLFIADFAPPRGGVASQLLARAYYRPVNVAAWALRLCSLHPLYDYAERIESLGLSLERRDRFRVFARGPAWFESLAAAKAD